MQVNGAFHSIEKSVINVYKYIYMFLVLIVLSALFLVLVITLCVLFARCIAKAELALEALKDKHAYRKSLKKPQKMLPSRDLSPLGPLLIF